MKSASVFFHRFSLQKKFNLIFGTITGFLVLLAIAIGIGLKEIDTMNNESALAAREVELIEHIQYSTSMVWQYYTDISLTGNLVTEQRLIKPMQQRLAADFSAIVALGHLSPQEKTQYAALQSELNSWSQVGAQMVKAYSLNKKEGNAVMDVFDRRAEQVVADLEVASSAAVRDLHLEQEKTATVIVSIALTLGVLAVISIIVSVLLARWMTTYIAVPINKIADISKHVAQGEFVLRITNITEQDEIGKTCWEFNNMLDQLEALIKEIMTSVEYAGEGKYFRKPLHVGLTGMLRTTAQEVAKSINDQEQRTNRIKEEHDYLEEKTSEMLTAMERFAEGDLTVSVHKTREDQVGKMFDGFNKAVENLNRKLSEVNDAVEKAASSSATISSSATQMAAGAEEQSTQVGEVASAVEEISKTIAENAENAQEAAGIARASMEAAQNGGEIVQKTIRGMETISGVIRHSAETINTLGESSSQIGEIISVINDIADQTNLLALNAAIEAARAGEQGRGFAVVADEVRKLAERTTKATKEISVMIRRIQEETQEAVVGIQNGAKNVEQERVLAGEAGEALNEIVAKVNRVAEMIATIATANAEQARASEDITRNINGISSVTDENAQAIDQIARSTSEVEQITGDLHGLVGQFTLGAASHYTRPAPSSTTDGRSDFLVQPDGRIKKQPTAFNAEKSKTAHKLWRMRVMKMIDGTEHITENEVMTHRECALGKWYYSEGKTQFGDHPVYRDLGANHESMHNQLKKIVVAWNNGQRDEAKALTKGFYEMSERVVDLIDRLKEIAVHHS